MKKGNFNNASNIKKKILKKKKKEKKKEEEKRKKRWRVININDKKLTTHPNIGHMNIKD